jgi:hypothetical protein
MSNRIRRLPPLRQIRLHQKLPYFLRQSTLLFRILGSRMRVKLILPALTEAAGPFWRPIKYSLFPPLGLATLAGHLRYLQNSWKPLPCGRGSETER